MSDSRFVFLVEWFDIASSVVRKFNFTYYPSSKQIEMVDLKTSKTFLKKVSYPEITIEQLFIGNVIIVYSRQLKIIDYADVFTKNYFEARLQTQEKTFAMIKPDAYLHIGKIIDAIEQSGLIISNLRMTKMTKQNAANFYAEHQGKSFYEGLVEQMSSDLVVGIELVGENAIARWREIIGPTNPQVAKQQAPNSLRALYGTEGPKNVCHGSDSVASANRELEFFFHYQSELKDSAQFSQNTLALIKPHIVKQKQVGKIIDQILSAGFEISALQMFQLDVPTSKEFFEVYKGVLPEYSLQAEHMTKGSCYALEIRQNDAVNKFRELCGPHDPEIARHLAPETIRAKFGKDRVLNAIHCTDLPEDGNLEVQYFFNVLMVPGWKQGY
ncbi:Nucleoside diphosphate kinase [Pseudocohnilembus persalinus]|uniref:Nucleoside diphosphate kinase n=1 Tax=Pseudocohnilembus persalinus TaxID=266149 RepID=A0A0V0R6P1_PSEPJ|nr:Nucleoside diphosphate kinase [Pseudocohnilembus persalinus]|eukprot:KRX10142.1 Nucleoside diphosphate kinase [Pseudocohnilembus persalinus]